MKTSFTFLKIFFLLFLFASFLTKHSQAAEEVTTTAPYPLSICLVSGDKLGEMGTPVIINYEGEEVRFCCKDCVNDFKKDPQKYLKRLHTAAAAQATPAASSEKQ